MHHLTKISNYKCVFENFTDRTVKKKYHDVLHFAGCICSKGLQSNNFH